ncbi:MAG TPA: hypothetical protein O0Y05_02460 [Methanocorpusculum sp.]|nr:hypothetical protein [Methanocorpusculum sp.]
MKKFIAGLPADLLVRILRYSDTAMWHIGSDPVLAGEMEWIDLPSDGYLSSLVQALSLTGQNFAAVPDIQNVVLLISDGALSDPKEIVKAVLAKRFDDSVIRAAIPLSEDADTAVLQMFAKNNIFNSSVLHNPHTFLSSFWKLSENSSIFQTTHTTLTLSCTINVGDGNSFSLSVAGTNPSSVKEAMQSNLMELSRGDEKKKKKIADYVRRLF